MRPQHAPRIFRGLIIAALFAALLVLAAWLALGGK